MRPTAWEMPRGREDGSAVVGFVFTSLLVTLLFLALLQVALAMHARIMLIDIAGQGARVAGRHDSSLSEGKDYARELAQQVPGEHEVSAQIIEKDGLQIVEFTVTGTLPVLGTLGVPHGITATGHGMVETYVEVTR